MAESFDIRQANGQGPLGKEPTSPQLISGRTRVTAEILAHFLHLSPAQFAGLLWMFRGSLLQSHRARLQMNRILSWARAAPQTGN